MDYYEVTRISTNGDNITQQFKSRNIRLYSCSCSESTEIRIFDMCGRKSLPMILNFPDQGKFKLIYLPNHVIKMVIY